MFSSVPTFCRGAPARRGATRSCCACRRRRTTASRQTTTCAATIRNGRLSSTRATHGVNRLAILTRPSRRTCQS